MLSAIRLETARNATLDRFLSEMLWGGPVICDQHGQRYYALVPADMPLVWHKAAADWTRLNVEILGRDTHLGVPRLALEHLLPRISPSYWAVPMRRPGELCDPNAVARLMAAAIQTLSSVDET
ncbi:hypothetical protein ACH4C6_07710 [Streptomyces sp. NPDC017943]|uniref:hypothetical protein n=1 Tax=Streptomyces sp. NPDC017943 TaxID=3365019 RepID=UPI003793C5D9